ncbi:MAG: hypothetical protein DRJ43_06405, partial [Thermoprotei archaeon]
DPYDYHGHGTHCAGIAAGVGGTWSMAHSGVYAWYSGQGNNLDAKLYLTLNLTSTTSATLRFWTLYAIEEGWDYGFVLVSPDGGATWQLLDAYTGFSGGWVERSYNLSQFAGGVVTVLFEYVTDESVAYFGWYIDDVSVPEIGFYDDIETVLEDWSTEDWSRANMTLSLAPGVAPGALVMAGKVLNKEGWGQISWIVSGIEWAVENGADVISMSLGGGFTAGDDPLSLACDAAVSEGVVVVVAAGNEGPDFQTITAPGSARRVITVGAVDKSATIAPFSSRGPTLDLRLKPEVVAPGVYIRSAYPLTGAWGLGAAVMSGTSMATPHVAGIAALLLEAFPSMSPDDVKSLIASTAVPLRSTIFDVGAGLANAYSAITALAYLRPAILDLGIVDGVIRRNITIIPLTVPLNLTFSVEMSSMLGTVDGVEAWVEPESTLVTTLEPFNVTLVVNVTAAPYLDFEGWVWVYNVSRSEELLVAHGVFTAFRFLELRVLKLDPKGVPAALSMVYVLRNESFRGFMELNLVLTDPYGYATLYLPEGSYYLITFDLTEYNAYALCVNTELSRPTYLVLNESAAPPLTVRRSASTITMERGVSVDFPVMRVDEEKVTRLDYLLLLMCYYPLVDSDYVYSDLPLAVKTLSIGREYVDPANPLLIRAPKLDMFYAVMPSVRSPLVVSPAYNSSVEINYATAAWRRLSIETCFDLYLSYSEGSYSFELPSFAWYINAPHKITVLTKASPALRPTLLSAWMPYATLPGRAMPYDYSLYTALVPLSMSALAITIPTMPDIPVVNSMTLSLLDTSLAQVDGGGEVGAPVPFIDYACYNCTSSLRLVVNGSVLAAASSRLDELYLRFMEPISLSADVALEYEILRPHTLCQYMYYMLSIEDLNASTSRAVEYDFARSYQVSSIRLSGLD